MLGVYDREREDSLWGIDEPDSQSESTREMEGKETLGLKFDSVSAQGVQTLDSQSFCSRRRDQTTIIDQETFPKSWYKNCPAGGDQLRRARAGRMHTECQWLVLEEKAAGACRLLVRYHLSWNPRDPM